MQGGSYHHCPKDPYPDGVAQVGLELDAREVLLVERIAVQDVDLPLKQHRTCPTRCPGVTPAIRKPKVKR